jgi:holo-[acyl-carrier protein] synthase
MVVGIGVDMVNIQRIEHVMTRWGDLFLGRVFTEKEIRWCQKRVRPVECFATRFAAKEAFLKALGWGLRNGIQWKDIEVGNDPMGKPFLSLYNKGKQALETLGIQKSHLTLSHERLYAVAYVLLEGGTDEGSDC